MTRAVAVILSLLIPLSASAQFKTTKAVGSTDPTVRQVTSVVNEILTREGIQQNIAVSRLGRILAYSYNVEGKRLLSIGDSLDTILSSPDSIWRLRGIVAHEIGHHLAGHPVYKSRESIHELEADHYSGFVLAEYGASLTQAQSGVRAVVDQATQGRAARMIAIKDGWCAARRLAGESRQGFKGC